MGIQRDTYDTAEDAGNAVTRFRAQGLTSYKVNIGGGYWEVRTVTPDGDEMSLSPLTDEPFTDPDGRTTFNAVRNYGF